MRTFAAALLLVAAVSATAPIVKPPPKIGKEADNTFLLRQKDFIRLLIHLDQALLWEDLATVAKEYKIQPENYKVPHVAEEYLKLQHAGHLPHDLPVSVLDEHHVHHIKIFLDLLLQSKDYDVFFKTALHLRERVNKGLFLPAFYMAAALHPDTNEIVLPPLHDVNPQLFFTSDAVQQIYDAKLQAPSFNLRPDMQLSGEANYTGFPNPRTPEQKITYFTEDVGLNEFVAQFFYHYPYFLEGEKYGVVHEEVRGNVFYHTMRQLYARYVLERLANGLPEVEPVNYEGRVKAGFYPQVRMQNGVEFGTRPANVYLRDVDSFIVERIRNAEYRINEVAEMGYVISEKDGRQKYKNVEATNILGNLVQSTADSIHPKYYGAFFRDLLSLFAKSSDVTHKYGVASSVLGNYETMARDPVFFQIVKRVLNVFQQYKDNLPPYTKEELEYPGFKIESVDVDRLLTFFLKTYTVADNLILETTAEEAENTTFGLQQLRLMHKPYTYRIKVSSEKPVKAIFRIFIGPRVDAYGNDIPLDVARNYFLECDHFVYNVSAGQSEIVRNSRDSPVYRHDSPPGVALLEVVNVALNGGESFKPFGLRGYGFPERLALPKGSKAGLPLRFYVIASPLDEQSPAASADKDAELFAEFGGAFREWFVAEADTQDVGFPFDRRIPHFYNFSVPNSYFKDVLVYHMDFDESNFKTLQELNKTTA